MKQLYSTHSNTLGGGMHLFSGLQYVNKQKEEQEGQQVVFFVEFLRGQCRILWGKKA